MAIHGFFGATVTSIELVLRIWDFENGNIIRSMQKHDSECVFLNFIDLNKICAISELGTIYIYNITTANAIIEQKIFKVNFTATRITNRDINSAVGHIISISLFDNNSIICGILFFDLLNTLKNNF